MVWVTGNEITPLRSATLEIASFSEVSLTAHADKKAVKNDTQTQNRFKHMIFIIKTEN